jgi:hypothetical protein
MVPGTAPIRTMLVDVTFLFFHDNREWKTKTSPNGSKSERYINCPILTREMSGMQCNAKLLLESDRKKVMPLERNVS